MTLNGTKHNTINMIKQSNLQRHLQVLAKDIGVRLAGSDREQQAADYIAQEFQRAGANVAVEQFAVRERSVKRELLEMNLDGCWQTFPSSLFSNTPGTEGQAIEAPVVFFESPAESQRTDLSHLTGKAVVHLGCHIESRDAYSRLVEAKPAFLLMVDIRHPGSVPLADGMFPTYTTALGAVPTVNVAYMDAWRWKVAGATSARLMIEGGMQQSVSQNVIAELPGEQTDQMPDTKHDLVFLGGHHDTQADSPGADDNATAVAGILECARTLARQPRKRTIRLISFGAEEQLSVGSAAYVRSHRESLQQHGRFMFNLDSFGSPLGWNDLIFNGPDTLAQQVRNCFEPKEIYFRFLNQVIPYADHFPFAVAGIPAVTLIRSNCTSGRFFHHRPDDDLDKVSTSTMATLLNGIIHFIDLLTTTNQFPFPPTIPTTLQNDIDMYWNDLFGGWENP